MTEQDLNHVLGNDSLNPGGCIQRCLMGDFCHDSHPPMTWRLSCLARPSSIQASMLIMETIVSITCRGLDLSVLVLLCELSVPCRFSSFSASVNRSSFESASFEATMCA